MRTENDYGGYEEAYYREGIRHGLSREFGPCPMRSDNLWHVYVYNCGKITGRTHISRITSHIINLGQFWKGCLGGGYITGTTKTNELTGINIAYIFPNLEGLYKSQLTFELG